MAPINESDLDWTELDEDDTTFRRKQLGQAAGSEQLGCSLYELPAGSRSWPYHYHTANEEAMYVLAGTGMLRLDGQTHEIGDGDYVAFPADASGCHRVVNDGDDALRYLAFSTMNEPDVTMYPEMNTFGVFVGSPPGGRDERTFHGFYDVDADVGYWDDE